MTKNRLLLCFLLSFAGLCSAENSDFSYHTNSAKMAKGLAEALVIKRIKFEYLLVDGKYAFVVGTEKREILIGILRDLSIAEAESDAVASYSSAEFDQDSLLLLFSCVLLEASLPYSVFPSGAGGEVRFSLSPEETGAMYDKFYAKLKSGLGSNQCGRNNA